MVRKSDLDLARRHRYRLSNGELARSVTAVSDGFVDDGKSRAFAYAAVNLAKQGKDFAAEWRESGQRGTRIHGHMETWLTTGESAEALNDDEAAVLEALALWFEHREVEVVDVEMILLSDAHGYGGRADLLAWVTVKGQRDLWLLDLKTGKPYEMSHTLQVNAYAFADGKAEYDPVTGELVGLVDFPRPSRVGCLYVSERGCDLVEYELSTEAFGVFCDLLKAKESYEALKKRLAKEGEE